MKRKIEPMIVSGHTLVIISFLIFAHSSLLPRDREVRTNEAIKKAKVVRPDKRRGKLESNLDQKDLLLFVLELEVVSVELILSTI